MWYSAVCCWSRQRDQTGLRTLYRVSDGAHYLVASQIVLKFYEFILSSSCKSHYSSSLLQPWSLIYFYDVNSIRYRIERWSSTDCRTNKIRLSNVITTTDGVCCVNAIITTIAVLSCFFTLRLVMIGSRTPHSRDSIWITLQQQDITHTISLFR